MNFTEFESIMSSLGANTLADISRKLKTTPQAVSNWKSRDQVPYHIVNKINQYSGEINGQENMIINQPHLFKEDDISFSDVLLIIAQQLKVILIIPFVIVFVSFVHVQFVKAPLYTSCLLYTSPSPRD